MTMLKLIGKGATYLQKSSRNICFRYRRAEKAQSLLDILNELFKRGKSTPDEDTLDSLTRSYSPLHQVAQKHSIYHHR